MATPGSTIADRITDLIGATYATIPNLSYKDLINSAFNEVADMISEDLLLKYSAAPTPVTSSSGVSIEGKKVLKVIRVDANSGGIERECLPLERTAFSAARDSNSIYHSTVYSPVYSLDSMNAATTVVIYPDCNNSGQEGNIFYFAYATDATDLTAVTAALLNTSYFLPNNLIYAIVLKSSINILNAYISNQVQDEEDIELMQMIQQQMQGLQKDFITEMQRFVDESGKPGSE